MKISYLFIATAVVFQSTTLWAQGIDQSKMDRDLKIAEDVVSSLIKGESNDGRFYAANPKASYIPGFGVMIDINSSGKFYSNHFDPSYNIAFSFDEEDFRIDVDKMVKLEMQAEMLERQAEEIERRSEIIERENERMLREQQRALEERERELEREMERVEREREREEERAEYARERNERDREESHQTVVASESSDDEYTYRYSYSRSENENKNDNNDIIYATRGHQKDFEDLKPMYKKVMTTFLTDYADLIGQLADSEQVMLVSKGTSEGYGIVFLSSSDEAGKFSASASRKNISDFKGGKISKSNFESGINFVETKGSDKNAADLELFTSIFQRLYKTDLATTYYTSTPITYEFLKSFGVIYKMKMYSSVSMGRDNYRMPTQRKNNLSREERDKQVEELYPTFINEFKKNILDYGKTIKSLESDESILFQVRLTECNSCNMPTEINILVKNQTLLDLDSGKISKTSALEQIQVKEAR